jgi:serpin B
MRNRVSTLLTVGLVVVLGASCGAGSGPVAVPTSSPIAAPSSTPSGPPLPAAEAGGITLVASHVARSSAPPDAASIAAQAANAFGLDLYLRLALVGGNIVISPPSIVLALAMARAGAHGATADEMDVVLRSIGSDDSAPALNALEAALASRSTTVRDDAGNDLDVTLRIANAPFAQRGMSIEPGYLDALASRFGAGLRIVDYRADPEGARGHINGWVSEQTERRIPELLAPGTIDALTRLALVNAVYLKAPWANPFAVETTRSAPFTTADGATVQVPFMSLSESVAYAEGSASDGGAWHAVELPYLGGSLALTVIVPDHLAAFESALTPGRLASVVGALRPRPVILALPKFRAETRADLGDLLGAMGMRLAFDPTRADFSGITTGEALYVSRVVHQANIDVDEAGTEAAAATAVVMRATGALADAPVTLRVDRPFLFALRDVPTGAVVFLGRVSDPSSR